MTTITCPKCHAAVEATAKFCPKCGQALADVRQCPACGAANKAEAYYCFKCGAALAGAGARPATATPAPTAPGPGGASLEDVLQNKLESRLKGVQERLQQRLGRLGEDAPAPPQGAPAAFTAAALSSGAPAHVPLVHQAELQAVYTLDPGETRQAAGLILNSRMVEANPLYKERAKHIHFVFADRDPAVNAFATDQALEVGGGNKIQPPAIVFFAGLARAAHVAAAAMAVYLQCRDETALRQVFREMGRAIVAGGGLLEFEAYKAIFENRLVPAMNDCLGRGNEGFMAQAQSIRLSMFMEVIAHEVGHVVLCHTLGQAFNYDISRNQEREADSVASSILSTCPYREYHFLGQALGNIIFVWLDAAGGAKEATTHPLSRERFNNIFISNSEAAAEAARAFGLGRAQFEALLPQ